MRTYFYTFLLLYIYSTFPGVVYGQKIHLEIKGKDSLETQTIEALDYRKSFDDFNSLKSEVDTVETQLQRKGYTSIERMDFSKKTDSSYLSVLHLNKQYKRLKIQNTQKLKTYGFTKRDLESFSLEVSTQHIIIAFEMVETALHHINAKLSERGDPFITVQLALLKPSATENDLLESSLVITTQKQRTVNDIIIRGYEKFPQAFLKYTIGIKKEMLFQKQKITKKSELLNALGFVKNTKPPEVLFTDEKTVLYLYLEKVPNNVFDGIIGFATNEESNKLEFNGYLNLVLSNNLNFGESLRLEYKNDGNDQVHFLVHTELPYLFKTPFGLELGLEFFKRDSTFLTVEKQALANYRFSTKTKVFGGYKDYESTYLPDEQLAGVDVADYASQFLVLGADFSIQQNSSIFPYKTSVRLSNEMGSRRMGSNKTGQYRLRFTAKHIFNLNPLNSIYIGNQSGVLSSNNYLTNELFRFGGINSIRGVEENSIDASLFSVLNTEYRFLLSQNSYTHSITDIAYFENQNSGIKSKIYSFGIGFGLETKAGIFKLNIANGTPEKQNFKFANTKIHISLNTKF